MVCLLLIETVAGFSAAAQSLKLDPLPLVLPKPLSEGLPAPTDVLNLEKPLGRPRAPFLALAGTANVALREPVSSSDSDPVVGALEVITDGSKAGTDSTFVRLKEGVQSAFIELGSRHTIHAVLVWHYLKEPRAYADVVVQVADKAETNHYVEVELFRKPLK